MGYHDRWCNLWVLCVMMIVVASASGRKQQKPSLAAQAPLIVDLITFNPAPAPQHIQLNAASNSQARPEVADAYDGCFHDRGCFGTPADCVSTRNCDVLLTYGATADGVALQLSMLAVVPPPAYAAFGISGDSHMGSDAVMYCACDGSTVPDVRYGYNTGHSSQFVTEPNPNGTSQVQTWSEDGMFMCSFQQDNILRVPDHEDLDLTQEHYLLVATGLVDASGPHYHNSKKIASGVPVNLTQYSAVPTAGVSTLVRAHAICMVMAWVGLAGTGVLTAQHLRFSWSGRQLWGKDVWFTIHRSVMVTTALATVAGFIFIIVHEKELSFEHNHNIVGFVVFLLSLLQVAGGLVRPGLDSRLRPYFNWLHRLLGLSALVLSLVALGLVCQLPGPAVDGGWLWLVVSVALIDVAVTAVLLALRFRRPGPAKSGATAISGDSLRKAAVFSYVVCSTALAAVLVTLVGVAQPAGNA